MLYIFSIISVSVGIVPYPRHTSGAERGYVGAAGPFYTIRFF